ncbi:MAG TPA: hypothetical protein VMS08_00460 [Candidatus Saccharimonadia bacterium]|nr:hypothetical protein [Candidatus Saccharimonadia bacterium]
MNLRQQYAIKLQDARWQKKRLEVFERDKWKCRYCGGDQLLQAHHIKYEFGRDPWDYPLHYFITLCDGCHKHETANRKITEKMLLITLAQKGWDCDVVGLLAKILVEIDNKPLDVIECLFHCFIREFPEGEGFDRPRPTDGARQDNQDTSAPSAL